MKTFRLVRPCNPGKLCEELTAAGVPVIVIRASHSPGDPKSLANFAVVVTGDDAPPNTLGLINSHIEDRTPRPWSPPDGKTLEEIVSKYEEL